MQSCLYLGTIGVGWVNALAKGTRGSQLRIVGFGLGASISWATQHTATGKATGPVYRGDGAGCALARSPG